MRPGAVVFDNDGLLLDTEPCWTRAQETVFRRRGRVFDLAAKHALVGTAPDTAATVLERLLDEPGRGQQLSAEMYALALEEIASAAAPGRTRSNACARCAALFPSRSHPTTRAATSSPACAAPASTTPSTSSSASTTSENPKPSPDRYLRACELLGVPATRASALEDSPPGVAAARAAGLFVIGIPSVPAIELAADVVAESLGDPRVREALDLDETAES